jgi:hypothetical protein
VFARSEDMAANGGLPKVDFVSSFGLTDSGTHTLSATLSGVELDALTYVEPQTRGASTQVDADKETPAGNDEAGATCATPVGTVYGAGDRGTPGAANVQCP